MKTKSSRLIAWLTACLLLLAGCSILLFGRSMGIDYANADRYTAGDTVVTAPVENLDINWTSGKVSVEYHDGPEIRVSETSDRGLSEDDRLRWWLDGTTLRVQYRKAGIRLSLFSVTPSKTLTLSLPKGTALKTVSVRATSADIIAPELTADELTLESTSGDILVSAEARTLNGGSTSGNLQLTLGSVDLVSLTATSGSISVTLKDAKDLFLSSTSGDLFLTQRGETENLKLNTTSGHITLDTDKAAKVSVSSTSGSVTAAIRAFEDLSVGCTSGSVNAALPDAPGFTGEFQTTSGSFSSEIALEKSGNTYTCGDGSARCSIHTTSGNISVTNVQ